MEGASAAVGPFPQLRLLLHPYFAFIVLRHETHKPEASLQVMCVLIEFTKSRLLSHLMLVHALLSSARQPRSNDATIRLLYFSACVQQLFATGLAGV